MAPWPREVHSSGCRPYVTPRNSSSSGGQESIAAAIARGVVGSAAGGSTGHHPMGPSMRCLRSRMSVHGSRQFGSESESGPRSGQNQTRTHKQECAATKSESGMMAASSDPCSLSCLKLYPCRNAAQICQAQAHWEPYRPQRNARSHKFG